LGIIALTNFQKLVITGFLNNHHLVGTTAYQFKQNLRFA